MFWTWVSLWIHLLALRAEDSKILFSHFMFSLSPKYPLSCQDLRTLCPVSGLEQLFCVSFIQFGPLYWGHSPARRDCWMLRWDPPLLCVVIAWGALETSPSYTCCLVSVHSFHFLRLPGPHSGLCSFLSGVMLNLVLSSASPTAYLAPTDILTCDQPCLVLIIWVFTQKFSCS